MYSNQLSSYLNNVTGLSTFESDRDQSVASNRLDNDKTDNLMNSEINYDHTKHESVYFNKKQSQLDRENQEYFQEAGGFHEIDTSDIWIYSVYYELPSPLSHRPAVCAVALVPFSYMKLKPWQRGFVCHLMHDGNKTEVSQGSMTVVDDQWKKGVTR